VIAPNAGGAGDLAADDYAQTYPPGDSSAAAKAILELLGRDRATLSSAAFEAGKQRVGDIENHFEKLFVVYAQAAQNKRTQLAAISNRTAMAHEKV
jgi:alpha-1,6-mannosyltransferase